MHLPGPRTHYLTSTPPYQERLATHTRVGGAVGIGDAKATPFTVNPLWEGSGRISGIGRARPKSTHDTRNEGMRMQCLLVHYLN